MPRSEKLLLPKLPSQITREEGWVKVFLFLYPIKEFVEVELEGRYLLERGLDPYRLSRIIDYRYRKRGFQVIWLMFSQGRWLHKPDRKRTSDIFDIFPEDLVIGCGVSFADHCANWHYPNLKYVFSQIPCPIDELIIGGFHQSDCVDKTAEYAHGRGIKTWVDEDTTQHFFSSTAIDGNIPLNRRGPDIYASVYPHGQHWVNRIREVRKGKPWFDQLEGPN